MAKEKMISVKDLLSLLDYVQVIVCKERDEAVKGVKAVFPEQDMNYGYAMGLHEGLDRTLSFTHFLKTMLRKVK